MRRPLREVVDLDDDERSALVDAQNEANRRAAWTQDTELLAQLVERMDLLLQLAARGFATVQVEKLKSVKPGAPLDRPDFVAMSQPQSDEVVMSVSEFFSWTRSNEWAMGGAA